MQAVTHKKSSLIRLSNHVIGWAATFQTEIYSAAQRSNKDSMQNCYNLYKPIMSQNDSGILGHMVSYDTSPSYTSITLEAAVDI